MAAVASTDIPKELRSNEHARARLAQLRRWASGLEQAVLRQQQAAQTAQPEYAAIATTQPPQPAPSPPVTLAPSPQAFGPALGAAGLGTATLGAVTPAAPAPAGPAPGTLASPPSPGWYAAAPQSQMDTTAPPAPQYPQPASTPAQVPVQAPVQPVAQAVAPFPAEAPAQAPLQTAEQPAAPPVTVPQSEPASSVSPFTADMAEASRSTEAAIAAAAAAFWARPELGGTLPDEPAPQTPPLAPPMPRAAAQTESVAGASATPAPDFFPLGQELPTLSVPTPDVQAPFTAPVPQAVRPTPSNSTDSDTFLDDLRGHVSTAEALLALPTLEQPDLLPFLRPSELAKVLKSTGDVELKKAVIETLESVGSPTALNVIYHCLDDPEPQIQAKALEAADRLLGAQ